MTIFRFLPSDFYLTHI